MLRLKIDKTTVKKIGKSVFLEMFPKSLEEHSFMVSLLDELPEVYNIEGTDTMFEIPSRLLGNVLNLYDAWDIELIGDVPKEVIESIRVQNLINDKLSDVEFTYKTKPMKHQIEAMEYAETHDKFLLGDEQGLGKTKQAIDISVRRKNAFKHCLIVCGVSSLQFNWMNEITKHSNEKGHIVGSKVTRNGNLVIESSAKRAEDLLSNREEFFLIINVEALRNIEIRTILSQMCKTGEIGMVVVDEVHKCKNGTSQQGEALLYLDSYFKLGMTGTPISNQPLDMHHILTWLGVEHHNRSDFEAIYTIKDQFGDVIGYQNLDKLSKTINCIMLRRLKEEVLDLPEKIHIVEYVEMGTHQKKIYNEVKKETKQEIDKVKINSSILAQFVRMRQATGNPRILTTSKVDSAKYARAYELIQDAIENNRKVVVFSNWKQVITPFFENLNKAYNSVLVTGDVADKQVQIDTFQKDVNCKVICGTLQVLGTGHTLTEGSVVIFLDEPWTMSDKVQAEDRAHRIGSNSSVLIYTLLTKGTVDERVHEVVKGKGKLSDLVIDGKVPESKTSSFVEFMLS